METPDVIALTQQLIAFNTVNPPGNEAGIARFLASLLSDHGFKVSTPEFGENRLHVLAEKGITGSSRPIVLSGHLDTVPLGKKEWERDPFGGQVIGDKLFGRGSSDMKAAVAAMCVAAIVVSREELVEGGIRLIFSAGEELGCQGIRQLAESQNLGKASSIIVGEPTDNIPAIGHKGALYLRAVTRGKTAHSSMPFLGDNAIYKAARCISSIETLRFEAEEDLLLGQPTINVGQIQGGMNINSVPDHAEFTMDIRSTTGISHRKILDQLKRVLGDQVQIESLVDLQAVSTSETDPFVRQVCRICGIDPLDEHWRKALPYLTDGSVLQRTYGGVPTIILGPGQVSMAHQTDEFCLIPDIHKAVKIYTEIIQLRRKRDE